MSVVKGYSTSVKMEQGKFMSGDATLTITIGVTDTLTERLQEFLQAIKQGETVLMTTVKNKEFSETMAPTTPTLTMSDCPLTKQDTW